MINAAALEEALTDALKEEELMVERKEEKSDRIDMVYGWQSQWKKASAAKKGSLASFFSSPNKHKRVKPQSPKRTDADLLGAPGNCTPNRDEAGSGIVSAPSPSPAPGGTVGIGIGTKLGMFAKHIGVKRSRSTMSTSPTKKCKASNVRAKSNRDASDAKRGTMHAFFPVESTP